MNKQLSEDDAMHNFGVIPVARLNHLPINYKKYKLDDDGCLEFKTKVELRNGDILCAVYHQWKSDFESSKDLRELSWVPSWYEYYHDNRGNL